MAGTGARTHEDVDAAHRVEQLEAENAELRGRLALITHCAATHAGVIADMAAGERVFPD